MNLMSGLRMNISEQNDVGALTVSIQNIENEYKNILTKIKKHKDTYELVLSYEDGNLCESFSKFNTSYNILQCEHFLSGNGISFKISEIVWFIYTSAVVICIISCSIIIENIYLFRYSYFLLLCDSINLLNLL